MADKKKSDLSELLGGVRMDKFVVIIAAAAFIVGFAISNMFFKQVQVQYQNVYIRQPPETTTCTQTIQNNTQTMHQNTIYDLVLSLSVLNPSLGRGETLSMSGQVTDTSNNPIGGVEIDANVTNSTGYVIASNSFTSFSNSTFAGGANIPITLGYLGDYTLYAKAKLGNRESRVTTFAIKIVR